MTKISVMRIIRISAKSNLEKKRQNFYKFLKTMNYPIPFYHGTSEKNCKEMEGSGWMSPPTWRGKEEEESRLNERTKGFTREEALEMGGLDKIFLTKDKEIASSYASQASRHNRSGEEVLEINVQLYQLDEVKGHVEGTFVYNETGSDRYCAKIIDSDLSVQEKFNYIMEYINNELEAEWTIKGGLRMERENGYRYVKTESQQLKDEEDQYLINNPLDIWWDMWHYLSDRVKKSPNVFDSAVKGYIEYLKEDGKWVDINDDGFHPDFTSDPRVNSAEVDTIIRLINKNPQLSKSELSFLIPERLKSDSRLTSLLN